MLPACCLPLSAYLLVLPACAAQDTTFHGRFSLNIPACMVEYRCVWWR